MGSLMVNGRNYYSSGNKKQWEFNSKELIIRILNRENVREEWSGVESLPCISRLSEHLFTD